MTYHTILISIILTINILQVTGADGDPTIPKQVETPYPTVRNITIEWYIDGDENQNSRVEVMYRVKGIKTWLKAMPLRRIPKGQNIGFTWENRHSGSIFDLEPNTEYEIKLDLEDPDGGSATRKIEVATRPIPTIPKSAEIIELAPGNYDTLNVKSGTKERPVVYTCSTGEAIFEHINMRNSQWVFIEGLVVENLFNSGNNSGINLTGAENCVIRRCQIYSVYGIVAQKPGAKNCYISDNVIEGIVGWTDEQTGAHGNNVGEGVQITGPGNVICYNEISGFRDGISFFEESRNMGPQVSIDIYNNELFRHGDDAIEADFCMSNCRIYRNRITNCYVGLSSQPGLGGPTYFIRNSMYNIVHSAFKLKRYSQGDVVLHNTVVRIGDGLGGNSKLERAYFRNNLAIGGEAGTTNWGGYGAGNPYGADIIEPGAFSDFDYDAVGVGGGVPYRAEIGGIPFGKVEPHGVEEIDLEKTFYNVSFPYPPFPEREIMDLRLKKGSKAIDAGVYIPNINDGYSGAAPDCGAYELGQDLPHYGPRPIDK